MKSTEYREQVYRLGLPTRIRQIEDELAAYFGDYPDLFLSTTTPQLLRPELKRAAAAAVNGNGASPKKAGGMTLKIRHTREKTEELLKMLAARPRTREQLKGMGIDMRGMHQIANNGYVTVKNGLYSRTAKPFLVSTYAAKMAAQHAPGARAPKRKKKDESAEAVATRRARSFETLVLFKEHGPFDQLEMIARGINLRAILPLVRRGYLKKTAAGFARTSKEFALKKTYKRN